MLIRWNVWLVIFIALAIYIPVYWLTSDDTLSKFIALIGAGIFLLYSVLDYSKTKEKKSRHFLVQFCFGLLKNKGKKEKKRESVIE